MQEILHRRHERIHRMRRAEALAKREAARWRQEAEIWKRAAAEWSALARRPAAPAEVKAREWSIFSLLPWAIFTSGVGLWIGELVIWLRK
jgi:hypothetical protein